MKIDSQKMIVNKVKNQKENGKKVIYLIVPYKGWIHEYKLAPSRPGNGLVVAVKKLKAQSFQENKEWLVSLSSFLENYLSRYSALLLPS